MGTASQITRRGCGAATFPQDRTLPAEEPRGPAIAHMHALVILR